MSKGKRFLKSSACFLAGVSIFNVAYCEPVGAIYEEEKEEALKKLDFLKRAYKFAADVALSEGGKLRFRKVLSYDYIGKKEIGQMESALKDFEELIKVSYKTLNNLEERSNTKKAFAKAIIDSFKDMFSVKSEELEKYNENFDVNKYIAGEYPTNHYFHVEEVKFKFENFSSLSEWRRQNALKEQNEDFIDGFKHDIYFKLTGDLGVYNDAVIYKFVNDNGGAESVYKMLCDYSQYESLAKALEWIRNACSSGKICELAKLLRKIMFADSEDVLKFCKYFRLNVSKESLHVLYHITQEIERLNSNGALQEFYTQCICILTKRLFNSSLKCKGVFNNKLLYSKKYCLQQDVICDESSLPYKKDNLRWFEDHCLYKKKKYNEPSFPYKGEIWSLINDTDFFSYKIAVQSLANAMYNTRSQNLLRMSESIVLPYTHCHKIFKYLTTEEKLNTLPEYLWKDRNEVCPLGRESSMEGRLVELALYYWKITKTTEMLSKFDNIVELIEKEDVTENDKLKILDSDSLIAIVKRLTPEDKVYLLNYLFPDRFEKFEKWGRIAAICFPGFEIKNFNKENKENVDAWANVIYCLTGENIKKLLAHLTPEDKVYLLNYLFPDKFEKFEKWGRIAAICFPGFEIKNFNKENVDAWANVIYCLTKKNRENLLAHFWKYKPPVEESEPTEEWLGVCSLCDNIMYKKN